MQAQRTAILVPMVRLLHGYVDRHLVFVEDVVLTEGFPTILHNLNHDFLLRNVLYSCDSFEIRLEVKLNLLVMTKKTRFIVANVNAGVVDGNAFRSAGDDDLELGDRILGVVRFL